MSIIAKRLCRASVAAGWGVFQSGAEFLSQALWPHQGAARCSSRNTADLGTGLPFPEMLQRTRGSLDVATKWSPRSAAAKADRSGQQVGGLGRYTSGYCSCSVIRLSMYTEYKSINTCLWRER